jgi:hypothetical protein
VYDRRASSGPPPVEHLPALSRVFHLVTDNAVGAGRLPAHHASKGTALSISLLNTGAAGLSPLPAIALGLVLGGVLVLVSKRASRLMTPENPAVGMAKVLVVNLWVLIVAAGSLLACVAWARSAFLWFGPSLAIGFLSVASYEIVRFGTDSTTATLRKR